MQFNRSGLPLLSLVLATALVASPAAAKPSQRQTETAENERAIGAFASLERGHDARPTGRDRVLSIRLDFPVRLSDQRWYSVAGYLYVAPAKLKHSTVQLVVHGATYNHKYWDAPTINGIPYSYAREMASRGYAVFAIDQLGTGASSKPNGDFFSLDEAASALHQVATYVKWLSPRRAHLAYVGHSNGSVTAIYAQGTYGDADGLVTTGWVHGFRGLPVDPSDPAVQAAVANPYISLAGPLRDNLMYYAPGFASDPAMKAYDSVNLLDSMPRTQFFDLIGIHGDIAGRGPGGMTELTRSQLVDVPVLVQTGDRDDYIAPASAGLAEPGEEAFFSSAPEFEFQVLEETGHSSNLHYSRSESWDGIDDWIDYTLE